MPTIPKITIATLAVIVLSVLISPLIYNHHANALSGWDAGLIISDAVFTNKDSLSIDQIQQFINAKTPECDANGTQPSEMNNTNVPDYNGDSVIERWEWGKYNYNQITFTCLKNYSENNQTSAQIIFNAAQQYAINPKVLIVLLQKEQSLITDTWPLDIQYRSATGYGCPDTAPCDSEYYGLTNQITWAARMYRSIMNDSSTWDKRYYPYWAADPITGVTGPRYIQYNPDNNCGGSWVNIQNRATQALYNYTPYQPNQAALDVPMGTTVGCGAYGNTNFYRFFTSWFGSTTAIESYGYSIVSKGIYSDATYQTKISDTPTIEPNQYFYIKLVIKNTGSQVWGKDTLHLGGENPKDRSSIFYTDGWLSPGRPSSMNEDSVKEGETATFTFKMKTPSYLGNYQESFGVLIEGQRWLDGVFNIPITVASSSAYYSAQTTSFDAYSDSSMTRKLNPLNITNYTDSKVYIKAIIKNTGNQTLPADMTKIATTNGNDRISSYSDGSWLTPYQGQGRAAKAQEGDILPQQTGTFIFSLTSPGTPLARSLEQFGLVIDGDRWLSENIGQVSIQTYQRPPQVLIANQVLEIGQSILSSDGKYRLDFQSDGNLVLYSPTRAIWASWTVGKNGTKLIMQSDGNLVLYRADFIPIWYSNTGGKGLSKLILQPDGNLVVYVEPWQPSWYSHTQGQ